MKKKEIEAVWVFCGEESVEQVIMRCFHQYVCCALAKEHGHAAPNNA